MTTKFYVPLKFADPVIDLAQNLANLLGNVRVSDAMLIEAEDMTVADAVDRVLAAAGREYLRKTTPPAQLTEPPHTDEEVAAWEAEESADKAMYQDWLDGRLDLAGQAAPRIPSGSPKKEFIPFANAITPEEQPAASQPPVRVVNIHNVIAPEISAEPEDIPATTVMVWPRLDDFQPEGGDGVPASEPEPKAKRAAHDPVKCQSCGEMFVPYRKSSTYCNKPACQKARKAEYMKSYHASRDGIATLSDDRPAAATEPSPEPDPAPVPVVIDEKPEPDPVDSDETLVLVPEDSLPHLHRANGKSTWVLKDGPLTGRILTTTELKEALSAGDLRDGWRVHHSKLGLCRVVKFGRKQPTYGVKQLFGEKANSLIDLAVLP